MGTWLMVYAGLVDVYVATRDDVISILFLLAADAFHTLRTYLYWYPANGTKIFPAMSYSRFLRYQTTSCIFTGMLNGLPICWRMM